jgi:Mrp family chromosome partitioning ATPase
MSKNFELMQEAERNVTSSILAQPNIDDGVFSQALTLPAAIPLGLEGIAAEECLKLVHSIFLMGGEKSTRLAAFASVDPGNGCTQVCAHASKMLAGCDLGSVCVVDANFRTPALARLFGIADHHIGLAEALRSRDPIRGFVRRLGLANHWLLPAGNHAVESASLLKSVVMNNRMGELRKEFDFVIIDCPALSTCSDAISVAHGADGLVLIVEANITRRPSAIKVTQNLRDAKVKILGAVYNKRTFPIPTRLYKLL